MKENGGQYLGYSRRRMMHNKESEMVVHGPHSKAGASGLQLGNENSYKSRTSQHNWGHGGSFSKGITASDLNVQ